MSNVIDLRIERAKRYAAEAYARNRQVCRCEDCRRAELLPAVQQLTKNYQPARQA